MNNLSRVLILKILGTLFLWCAPLILFPGSVLEFIGFPLQESYMFVRMLGWAYLSLCVGYYFALKASLIGKRLMGPIWAGIVSNGGACLYLLYYGAIGSWSAWGPAIQIIAWGSVVATAGITAGLFFFGVKGNAPIVA